MLTMSLRALAVASIALAAGELAPLAAADECFADWGAAGEVVRREKLLTVEQLPAASPDAAAGKIVKSTLCIRAGGYVYQLVIRAGDGRLKSTVVPAKGR